MNPAKSLSHRNKEIAGVPVTIIQTVLLLILIIPNVIFTKYRMIIPFANVFLNIDYYLGDGLFETAIDTCRKLKEAVDGQVVNVSCAPCRCLTIERSRPFRFGNDVYAFRNAINIAKYMGFKEIRIPDTYMTFSKPFKWDDINVLIYKEQGDDSRIKRKCYRLWPFYPMPKISSAPVLIEPELKDAFGNEMRDLMIDLADDVLVMHVRSGDIFDPMRWIHPKYGQPPCGYYRTVMQSRNWSKVLLFAENRLNPCVSVLKKAGAIHMKLTTLKQEIAMMLSAKNLVVGRGSFGYSMVLLSNVLKNLWTFSDGKIFPVQHQIECEPEPEYVEHVLKEWRNDRGQRAWMKNSSCLRWREVNTSLFK